MDLRKQTKVKNNTYVANDSNVTLVKLKMSMTSHLARFMNMRSNYFEI